MKYKLIAIGGTFDLLHRGHREFIKRAFERGERVMVGITSEEYAEEKWKMQNGKWKMKISSFEERKRELVSYLREKNWLERAEVVKIHDVYGGAVRNGKWKMENGKLESKIQNDRLEAIVVTKDTEKGARLINKKRKELGLKPLEIIKSPMVKADDRGVISSTRIRLGEIDREGRLYRQLHFWGKEVAEDVRMKFKKPLGLLLVPNEYNEKEISEGITEVIKRVEPPMVITVGDEVTKFCNQNKIPIDIAIVDFRVKRKIKYRSLGELGFAKEIQRRREEVSNRAGIITNPLTKAVARAIGKLIKDMKKKDKRVRIVKVRGEEDLAAIPAVLLAPLDSLILYGQPAYVQNESELWRGKPDVGVVAIVASEEKKRQVVEMFGNF